MPMKIALCQLNPTVGDLSLAYGLRTSAGRLSRVRRITSSDVIFAFPP
jgi:hypothetical protein